MGLIRKTLSVTTLGLIDFHSDKERIARSSRKTAKQAKKQTAILDQIAKSQQR